MNAGLLALLAGGLGAPVLVWLAPRRWQGPAAGAATMAVGAGGVALGAQVVSSGLGTQHVGWLVPLAGATFGADATSGLFSAVVGAVALAVGAYTAGYHQRVPLPAGALACLPLFVAAMVCVPMAASVTTFLLLWEVMALASLVEVLAEHHHERVRSAGVLYAVMTQLGFAAILLGLVVFAGAAGGQDFSRLALHGPTLPPATRSAVFLLTLAGFGSKAGLVPLHAWLPRAHPAAPSPVSALMSAAMVSLGIYGIVRVDLVLLGPGPRWWGLVLLVVGGLTAVYSVLQASVATDLKRLLAYSTSENMGLVTLALGAAQLLRSAHAAPIADIALAAALLHVVNHAAFKSLGFLGAGAVLAATGVRDLDRLGGLARRMPATTALFALAALGATGLPLGVGFASEWLLLQSLIHTPPQGGTMLALVMPFAVGVVALTAGLGVAAMVKAFGVGFLARPRSAQAGAAEEVSPGMRAGMALAASACLAGALDPGLLAPTLRAVLHALPATGTAGPSLGLLLRLPAIPGSVSPAVLALALAGAAGLAGLLPALLPRLAGLAGLAGLLPGLGTRHRPRRRPVPLWACGGGAPTARMEYTATSFAEPLQRVFSDVLRPDAHVEVTHHDEACYLVEQVRYAARIGDAVEERLYTPVVRAVAGWAELVRRAHRGSVHAYLAYGGIGLLIVLALAR